MATGATRPEAFWGTIELAARLHASTAELWSAIRAASARFDTPLPAGMFAEVNRLRSLAVGLRGGSERLMSASRSDAITSSMIGRQIYARPAGGTEMVRAWHVRFELDVIEAGVASTRIYNQRYMGALPATVGELMDDLEAYGAALGDDYSVSVTQMGTVTIGEY